MRDYVWQYKNLIILAGSGMGVDSRLPTYRGKQGMNHYEKDASIGLLNKDPLFDHRGYQIMLDSIAKINMNYFVVTSNVDGHFKMAGFDQDRILEVHGSYEYYQCSRPCDLSFKVYRHCEEFLELAEVDSLDDIPRCPKCGSISRPNILFFDDFIFHNSQVVSQYSFFKQFLGAMGEEVLILEIGVGESILTMKNIFQSIRTIKSYSICINPEVPSNAHDYHEVIQSSAVEGINSIWKYCSL